MAVDTIYAMLKANMADDLIEVGDVFFMAWRPHRAYWNEVCEVMSIKDGMALCHARPIRKQWQFFREFTTQSSYTQDRPTHHLLPYRAIPIMGSETCLFEMPRPKTITLIGKKVDYYAQHKVHVIHVSTKYAIASYMCSSYRVADHVELVHDQAISDSDVPGLIDKVTCSNCLRKINKWT